VKATWSSSLSIAPPWTLPEKLAMSGVINTVRVVWCRGTAPGELIAVG
jgi:hypothetical protein